MKITFSKTIDPRKNVNIEGEIYVDAEISENAEKLGVAILRELERLQQFRVESELVKRIDQADTKWRWDPEDPKPLEYVCSSGLTETPFPGLHWYVAWGTGRFFAPDGRIISTGTGPGNVSKQELWEHYEIPPKERKCVDSFKYYS